jgi:hypothetical protein
MSSQLLPPPILPVHPGSSPAMGKGNAKGKAKDEGEENT